MSSRVRIREVLTRLTIPLASGATIYQGEEVAAVPGTYTANVAGAVTGMRIIGPAVESVVQASGDAYVQADLKQPIPIEYFANDTGAGAIALSTCFLRKCYFKDGGTVTLSTDNGSGINYPIAGLVYAVHATDGVGICPIDSAIKDLLS
jgi:hypothetical protein